MTRLATRLLVTLLAAGLALAGVEAAIRQIRPQPRLTVTPGLTTPDPPGRYRLTPGYRGLYANRVEYAVQVAVNREGLRGPELRPREGALRVLAIGDSFTFGTGVSQDEVFIEQAAGALRSTGHRVVGLNAGTPGFGPPDAVSWLERHGQTLGPDVVILAVFLGNDLQDSLPDRGGATSRPLPPPGGWTAAVRSWFDEHSHAFTLLQRTVPLPWQRSVRGWFGDALPPEDRHLERELEAMQRNPPPWMPAALEHLERVLTRLSGMTTPVVVMLIPSDLQLDQSLLNATARHLGFDQPVDPGQPRRVYHQLLAAHAIPYLDLTTVLASSYRAGEPLYYRYDRHWTASAHAIAGQELAQFLVGRGLLTTGSTSPAADASR